MFEVVRLNMAFTIVSGPVQTTGQQMSTRIGADLITHDPTGNRAPTVLPIAPVLDRNFSRHLFPFCYNFPFASSPCSI